jgi:hypothetical protein
MRAIRSTRRRGKAGYVGVFHEWRLSLMDLSFSGINRYGGRAPVRRSCRSDLI